MWFNPDGYSVTEHGTIKDPGKFESEAIYVPYFWAGDSSDTVYVDDHAIEFYVVDNDDRAKFPGLLDDVYGLALDESETGFVNAETFATEDEYKSKVRELEDLPPSAPSEEDITTTDYEEFYQNNRLVLNASRNDEGYYYARIDGREQRVGPFSDYRAALRFYMDKTQFWPNVWFISDHGNAHLLDVTEDK